VLYSYHHRHCVCVCVLLPGHLCACQCVCVHLWYWSATTRFLSTSSLCNSDGELLSVCLSVCACVWWNQFDIGYIFSLSASFLPITCLPSLSLSSLLFFLLFLIFLIFFLFYLFIFTFIFPLPFFLSLYLRTDIPFCVGQDALASDIRFYIPSSE
jgi:hypothetical protein